MENVRPILGAKKYHGTNKPKKQSNKQKANNKPKL